MWRKILRVVSFVMAVALIAAYICYASHLAQQRGSIQRVERVEIALYDSTELCQFTSVSQIRKHLRNGQFELENVLADSIDAVKISQYIMQCGFVRDADVYTTYSGELYIDIRQHQPLMRLLCGGYNSYVTCEGDIFRSPRGGAYYAPVVTGSYKPVFKSDFEGGLWDDFDASIAREDEKLSKVCNAIANTEQEHRRCKLEISEQKKSKRKTIFERLFKSDEEHKMRVAVVDIEIRKLKRQQEDIVSRLSSLKKEKLGIECRKKKIEKRYDDFANMINFVSQIKEHSFWSAEIVQFVADVTTTGAISLRLVPRSGDFIIVFGTLDNSEEKLSKLQRFYDKGLSSIGWNEFKKIDVRYDKQVICTK